MAKKILPIVPPGQDALKGGIFFGSSLTPAGIFQNKPQNVIVEEPSLQATEGLKKTLAVFQEELQRATKQQQNVDTDNPLSQESVNTYLSSLIELLIDYSDLRNYVFFSSAYVELVYNINYLLINYPFKAYIVKDVYPAGALALDIVPQANSQSRLRFRNGLTSAVNPGDIHQDGKLSFNLSGGTIWGEYNVVDVQNNYFPVLNFGYAQYDIQSITSATLSNPRKVEISYPTNTPDIKINDEIIISGIDSSIDGTFIVSSVTSLGNTLELELASTVGLITLNYGVGGVLQSNNLIDILVDGVLSVNNTIEYRPEAGIIYKGFLISKSVQALNDFDTSISPVQRELLSSMNPTPWPRSPITNNIQYEGSEYDNWLTSEQNMVSGYEEDQLGFVNDTNITYNLVGALSLDETVTNQLIRRAIPESIINELNETEQKHFTKFVLVAGKLFDTIKVYIDFIKYTKRLNYTRFNQLSPDFYSLYAKHYGFALYDEENISYSSLITLTKDEYGEQLTLQEIQQQRQKELLINLFYLYSKKGTQASIKYLTSLLGAPKGLFVLEEFKYNKQTGQKLIDNDKVNVPSISYEADPDFPGTFKLKLGNDEEVNLREITLGTNVTGAQLESILRFGKTEYPFGYFGPNSYSTLQNNSTANSKGYLMLPLSFPDKYTGVTVEYMIPKGGYKKGIGSGYDETSIHLASLYEVGKDVEFDINDEPVWLNANERFTYELPAVFQEDPTTSDVSYLPINPKGTFVIIDTPGAGNTLELEVNGNTIVTINWANTIRQTIINLQREVNRIYSPEQYRIDFTDEGGFITVELYTSILDEGLTFDLLTNGLPDSTNINISSNLISGGVDFQPTTNDFIICRVEGKDLVIRLQIADETQLVPSSQQRVAIFNDLFTDDGLLHKLRLLYRPEGVEIHQDSNYIGLARWRDPSTAVTPGLLAINIPHSEIEACTETSLDVSFFADPDNDHADAIGAEDKLRWWDLFVGLPVNLNIFYKKVSVFEAPSIDHQDSLDYGPGIGGLEVEKYNFDFRNQPKDVDGVFIATDTLQIPCEFKAPFPFAPSYQSYTDDVNLYLTNISVNGLLPDMTLINQTYQKGKVLHTVDRQDWFNVGDKEYTLNSLLSEGIYSETLHQDYEYKPWLKKVLENYVNLSQEVYTYLALNLFTESIESKFRPMTKQFVPIVMNINNFAKLLDPLEIYKVRYTDIHKLCQVAIAEVNSFGGFRITDSVNLPGETVTAQISIPVKIQFASNTTPIQVKAEKHNLTNGQSVFIESVLGNTAANGTFTITVLDEDRFELDASVGNGDYVIGGIVYNPIYPIVSINSSGNITTDAAALVGLININWPTVTAVNDNEIILIETNDVVQFDTDVKLISTNIQPIVKIITTGSAQASNIFGMTQYELPQVGGSCGFSFERTIKFIPVIIDDTEVYIYYDVESGRIRYVYFDSEGGDIIYI